MTQIEAYLKLAESLPVDDPALVRRLERADKDILRGYGYDIQPWPEIPGTYRIEKLSTAPLGGDHTPSVYTVSREQCTCPDFPTARGNLCKHRLAIMIMETMESTQK